jgi:hypothetical protein
MHIATRQRNEVIVANLRDSQKYVRAAELGMGLAKISPHQVADDLEQWHSAFGNVSI